ncbi:SNF1-related protein kinase regulatory subunit beta-1 [Zea mays]|uniref:SNF1-related protein kinase regulatory subunit beta-1 n=1 Tax=Zea mays TaxID=4577 RepID=A0A1D6INZ4_MAIZE|nr:SNF1-related protein kinase regulatory subunit beta-1 [Zea mays]
MGNASGRAEDLADADMDDGNNVRRASSSSAGYVRGGGSSSSPDSSYGFHVPGEKEFSKEPPQLPSQLYLGVLNSRSTEEGCARPRHVVLDHLYIEKGWGAQPLVALGYTHRFRSKYVTCVLYKAIER